MYEFGNHTPLLTPRRQGAGGAITRIHYTPQGNKFGATDTQGTLFMWQGIQSNKKDPFIVSYACDGTFVSPLKTTIALSNYLHRRYWCMFVACL